MLAVEKWQIVVKNVLKTFPESKVTAKLVNNQIIIVSNLITIFRGI